MLAKTALPPHNNLTVESKVFLRETLLCTWWGWIMIILGL